MKGLYLCCPLLHKECKKDECYIHNGECRLTIHKEYSQQELIDRIDKAIERIETLKNDNSSYYDETIINNTIRDLLDILKGEEKW